MMQVMFAFNDSTGQPQNKRLQGQAGSVIIGRDPQLANLVIRDSQYLAGIVLLLFSAVKFLSKICSQRMARR